MEKRLTLCKDSEAQVWGVCKGIADHYEMDVTFVRIIALILLFSSSGFLPYFICWLAMPYHPDDLV
jgi:phage shock protein PspC (stress-responsive transcriptional regulator)